MEDILGLSSQALYEFHIECAKGLYDSHPSALDDGKNIKSSWYWKLIPYDGKDLMYMSRLTLYQFDDKDYGFNLSKAGRETYQVLLNYADGTKKAFAHYEKKVAGAPLPGAKELKQLYRNACQEFGEKPSDMVEREIKSCSQSFYLFTRQKIQMAQARRSLKLDRQRFFGEFAIYYAMAKYELENKPEFLYEYHDADYKELFECAEKEGSPLCIAKELQRLLYSGIGYVSSSNNMQVGVLLDSFIREFDSSWPLFDLNNTMAGVETLNHGEKKALLIPLVESVRSYLDSGAGESNSGKSTELFEWLGKLVCELNSKVEMPITTRRSNEKYELWVYNRFVQRVGSRLYGAYGDYHVLFIKKLASLVYEDAKRGYAALALKKLTLHRTAVEHADMVESVAVC